MTATSNENEKDLEKLFKIIHNVKFAMLTTINEDGTLHSRLVFVIEQQNEVFVFFRPMVNKQADSFHGELWFFTERSGKIFIDQLIFIHFSFVLAYKVTEVKKVSREVNVSYSDPEHQSCMFFSPSNQIIVVISRRFN